jgi:hypothetical protein
MFFATTLTLAALYTTFGVVIIRRLRSQPFVSASSVRPTQIANQITSDPPANRAGAVGGPFRTPSQQSMRSRKVHVLRPHRTVSVNYSRN